MKRRVGGGQFGLSCVVAAGWRMCEQGKIPKTALRIEPSTKATAGGLLAPKVMASPSSRLPALPQSPHWVICRWLVVELLPSGNSMWRLSNALSLFAQRHECEGRRLKMEGLAGVVLERWKALELQWLCCILTIPN